jgi:hypothetical protein
MKPTRVLVYPGEAENAFEVARALQKVAWIEVIGASSRAGHSRFIYAHCVEDAPDIDDPRFAAWIRDLDNEGDIHAIIPTHDHVAWRIHQVDVPSKIRLIGSSAATSAVCASKREMASRLARFDWHPAVHDAVPDSFPVFAKPDRSAGGKGAYRLDNRNDYERFFQEHSRAGYLVTEFLPGSEYTVDCFTDRHGILRFVGPRSREGIRAGISMQSAPLPAEPFQRIAEDLNRSLQFRGYWFFQTKLDRHLQHRFLEVSCRAAAGIGLHRQVGVNLPLLSLLDGLDIEVSILQQSFPVSVSRSLVPRYRINITYSRLYLDLDDTLIIRGQVNLAAIGLLLQARRRGIECNLITRHDGDPCTTLRNMHIAPSIFHRIIHLDWQQRKHDYIEADSIFIDNSFAERQLVSERCRIPVFDVDAIPALLDHHGEF